MTGKPSLTGTLTPGTTIAVDLPTYKHLPKGAKRLIDWYVGGHLVSTHNQHLHLKGAWAGQRIRVVVIETWTTTDAAGKKVTHRLRRGSKAAIIRR